VCVCVCVCVCEGGGNLYVAAEIILVCTANVMTSVPI
jgi:hypothetical protein